MTVFLTNHLAAQLQSLGIAAADFQKWFEIWKRALDEESSAFFGKDGGYVSPEVDGEKYRLRHVHLVPLLDSAALREWYEAYARGSRRTSDRILVYVQADNKDYLAIAILEEPDAHDIQKMATPEDRATMEGFAVAAEEFLIDGSIVV